ncbi:MAG: carbon-nitrogen hydrolase family protein [Kofleriaceae bacterium]|nr:carbon-nitrogen hydrolase family protein [Kofleriaceae bacterium]
MQAALVAVQLEIGAEILASPDVYRRHLETAATRAITAAGAADVRFVVFPELAGHLALYALAPPSARKAKTLDAALAAAAVRRPLEVLRGVASTRLLGARHAVLGALAPDGERWWKSVMGPLAKTLDAYVVAGSHLRLSGDGALTNASALFDPSGRLVACTDKVNLVAGMEDGARGGLGLSRGEPDAVPIIDTPLGRAATLICYDAFREPHTEHERFVVMGARLAARGGVTVVANPAANPWPWQAPWRYAAERELSRAEQWDVEGLCGMLREVAFAKYGITAHLVGEVLDLQFEGASEIVEREPGGVQVRARATAHDRGGHVTALVSC